LNLLGPYLLPSKRNYYYHMDIDAIMRLIATHVIDITNDLDTTAAENFISALKAADRVFVYGAGRSGLAARAFAMRLVQMGLSSYVIGETVTPALGKEDLLVLISGSGETTVVLQVAETAKKLGVSIISITSYPDSSLGKLSGIVIPLRGKQKSDIEKDHLKHQIEGVHSSLTPLGTLFEDTALIFLDGVVGRLMVELNKNELDMKKRHASV
jgi:6-phospho 3-hexuloisomerase